MNRNRQVFRISVALVVVMAAGLAAWLLVPSGDGGTKDFGIDLGSLKFGQERDGAGSANGSDKGRYHHLDPEFSFARREGWTVTNFAEGEGETVLVRRRDGTGAQIYLQPFEGEIEVTPERIKRDIPDMSVRDSQVVTVGGTQVLVFESGGAGVETVEAWFLTSGYLYQISAPIAQRDMVQSIIGSWEW